MDDLLTGRVSGATSQPLADAIGVRDEVPVAAARRDPDGGATSHPMHTDQRGCCGNVVGFWTTRRRPNAKIMAPSQPTPERPPMTLNKNTKGKFSTRRIAPMIVGSR